MRNSKADKKFKEQKILRKNWIKILEMKELINKIKIQCGLLNHTEEVHTKSHANMEVENLMGPTHKQRTTGN